MKIAVISDTHWQPGRPLPSAIEHIRRTRPDCILHAGDWTDLALLEELTAIAPTQAVAGNCDDESIAGTLGYSRVITLGGVNIGLTHGHLFPAKATPLSARHTFSGDDVQAVVFGHSHVPYNETTDGVLLFNPGSAVRPLGQVKRPSFGLLTVEDGAIRGEIIYIDK